MAFQKTIISNVEPNYSEQTFTTQTRQALTHEELMEIQDLIEEYLRKIDKY